GPESVGSRHAREREVVRAVEGRSEWVTASECRNGVVRALGGCHDVRDCCSEAGNDGNDGLKFVDDGPPGDMSQVLDDVARDVLDVLHDVGDVDVRALPALRVQLYLRDARRDLVELLQEGRSVGPVRDLEYGADLRVRFRGVLHPEAPVKGPLENGCPRWTLRPGDGVLRSPPILLGVLECYRVLEEGLELGVHVVGVIRTEADRRERVAVRAADSETDADGRGRRVRVADSKASDDRGCRLVRHGLRFYR